tara:strand:- start:95 stop:541 length:447 start_codon:yes stop_codon:yes gene_type:complete
MNKDTQLIYEAYQINEQDTGFAQLIYEAIKLMSKTAYQINEQDTGLDTIWQDGDVKITIKDVLNMTDEPIEIDPNELNHLLIKTKRDPARVQAADLRFPLVVTSKGGQYTKILDGQHRLVKALQNKVGVKVRVLNLDNAPEEFQQMFS